MTKDPNYPAMMWHPKTCESRVFYQAGDVPKGWINTHPNNLAVAVNQEAESEAPAADKAAPDMTRKEIVAALTDGGIPFDPASKVVVLHELLITEVKRVLTEAEIEFDAASPTKALLELLPKPE